MEIRRKDMPLKGWITTYETTIKDPKMDKQIKKIIDKQGDRIFKGMRLDEAALLPGDHHFSEDGNRVLGHLIYRGMKK